MTTARGSLPASGDGHADASCSSGDIDLTAGEDEAAGQDRIEQQDDRARASRRHRRSAPASPRTAPTGRCRTAPARAADGDVAGDEAVQAEPEERGDADRGGGQHQQRAGGSGRHEQRAVAQRHGEPDRGRQQHEVVERPGSGASTAAAGRSARCATGAMSAVASRPPHHPRPQCRSAWLRPRSGPCGRARPPPCSKWRILADRAGSEPSHAATCPADPASRGGRPCAAVSPMLSIRRKQSQTRATPNRTPPTQVADQHARRAQPGRADGHERQRAQQWRGPS